MKVGDKVKFTENSILTTENDLYIAEIKDSQYILSNGWSVQKDWVIKDET
ncbi:MAG: hypothetical protein GAK29_01424 [Acinetobacter bereziniae]|uniref:Uncharacterized protein n=1 Tax=Acinetobacter bereziniae TaxID=106648 RepID=A0A833PGR3_ACIBZ|nr:MAG: hypothetical protein GAK29_01424 [Acinetobacter bereziniae]